MARGLLRDLHITGGDGSVKLEARGFGTVADIATILERALNAAEDLMAREIAASQKGGTPRTTR